MDYLGLNYSILPVLMVHQKENQEVWFLKYLEVNNMARKTTKWGQTFTSNRAGLWSKEGGVTIIKR